MRQSMTGFASGQGRGTWTKLVLGCPKRQRARSRHSGTRAGLDRRIGQAVRALLTKRLARGSVTVSLRLQASATEPTQDLNEGASGQGSERHAADQIEAMVRGLSLTASTAADLISLRGVMDATQNQADPAEVRTTLIADFEPVLEGFVASRQSEGAALVEVLTGQVAQISDLVAQAAIVAEARKGEQVDRMRAALARVMDSQDNVDERCARSSALIAVKARCDREIDRLRAHIDAARDLIQGDARGEAQTRFPDAGIQPRRQTRCVPRRNLRRSRRWGWN